MQTITAAPAVITHRTLDNLRRCTAVVILALLAIGYLSTPPSSPRGQVHAAPGVQPVASYTPTTIYSTAAGPVVAMPAPAEIDEADPLTACESVLAHTADWLHAVSPEWRALCVPDASWPADRPESDGMVTASVRTIYLRALPTRHGTDAEPAYRAILAHKVAHTIELRPDAIAQLEARNTTRTWKDGLGWVRALEERWADAYAHAVLPDAASRSHIWYADRLANADEVRVLLDGGRIDTAAVTDPFAGSRRTHIGQEDAQLHHYPDD